MEHSDYACLSIEETFVSLRTNAWGLTEEEAAARRIQYGLNELPAPVSRSIGILFIKQFKSLLILVLFLAGILSWFTGHRTDAYVIAVVVMIDALIGFSQEWKAERALASLHKLLVPQAKVLRNGQRVTLKASQLVPGDIVSLEEGDYIPADGRLIEVKNLRTIESSLTGESLPVNKSVDAQPVAVSLGDKKNMVWGSTFVASGYGIFIVTGTGSATAIGKIAQTLAAIPVRPSHFQQKINTLATQMGVASLFAAIVLFVVGYFTTDMALNELFLVSVAAMVSIIPEGLQSIIVIVLAIGSMRMTRRNAIVREFTSTETLGAVTTIITDKTGTLTENALTVKKLFVWDKPDILVSGEGWMPLGTFTSQDVTWEPAGQRAMQQALLIAGVCNNASIHHDVKQNIYSLVGDPTEGALLVLSRKAGISIPADNIVKIDDLPFDPGIKMRATLVRHENARQLFVIGAPEMVLKKCTHVFTDKGIIPLDENMRASLYHKINTWSQESLRVIGIAYRDYQADTIDSKTLEQLVFVSVAGMIDPPRKGVKAAIQQCHRAGIRVIMATGDHISTATSIARATGILDERESEEVIALSEEQLKALDDEEFDEAVKKVNVFARLNPETKMRIASRLQALGELIAMTGDGVNDAPALKKADVGIAMGIMGTDVARQSAKVVLADDNFSTIVHAIEEGRIVFMNARQASFYLITTNLAEICTLIFTIAFGLPMPLTTIQILWLNLVTDGVGDMALAAERGHGEALNSKPLNKDEKILHKSILPFLFINVTLMTLIAILAYHYWLPSGIAHARSGVFIVMSFTQLFNLYNMRSMTRSVFDIGIFSNLYITLTMISSVIITVGIIEIPFLKKMFGFGTVPPLEFAVLTALSSLVLWFGEIYKYWHRRAATHKAIPYNI
ncbi:MAG TPA: HAD-IC family P-type ATPase [Ohtaekwangia sp.]|uniref:cation-translocating P-type ATPase n=1 Tax=Ohtaekwangia sp. TaxID=2066019 RepID=UPI002F933311